MHFYPAADGASNDCDESNPAKVTNRLQAVRSLYDPSYTDPSWINTEINLIARYKQWIDTYYPGTKFSISEYSFGGDDCITSVIAHSEALAVMATYGVFAATRWSKPLPGAAVTNAFNIFTNYDGNGSNIYDSEPYAINVMDSNLEKMSTYSFVAKDETKMFVISFNKEQNQQNEVKVSLKNHHEISIRGEVELYGVDSNGLGYMGTVKPSNDGFSMTLAPWSIQLAIVQLKK